MKERGNWNLEVGEGREACVLRVVPKEGEE